MNSNNELQADIRAALRQCLVWMQAVKMGIETVASRAADRNAQIDIEALGKLVAEAGQALAELDSLIDRLLAGDIPADLDETMHLLYEGISKYASPTFWWKKGGKPSQAETDKGQFARSILEKISPDQSEGEGDE